MIKQLKLNKQSSLILLVMIYFVMSAIMYLIIRQKFIWNGDDIYYQFQRIQGIQHSKKTRVFPTLSTINFGKIGNGINLFYPWLTLVPFGIVGMFTNNPISDYYITLGLMFFISFLISHYSMYKLSGSTSQSIAFSMIYNLCNYRLIELIPRASLAEYIATIFLPLCFVGLYEILYRNYRSWYVLAIGMSLIVMTHVLTSFMTVILFVIILVVSIPKMNQRIKRMIALGYATLTTFLLSSLYLIPFLAEEKFQKYDQPDPQKLIGTDLWQSIVMGFNNSSRRMVEGNYYNIGTIMLIIIVIGLISFKKMNLTNKNIYVLGVGGSIVSTSIFPWHLLQNTPLALIQFPFRLLMFTSMFLSVTGSYLFMMYFNGTEETSRHGIIHSGMHILGLFAILIGFWSSSFSMSTSSKTLIANKHAIINESMISEKRIPDIYLAQYVPKKAEATLNSVAQHQAFINGKSFVCKPVDNNGTAAVSLGALHKNEVIDMPFIKYKYSKIMLNNHPIQSWSSDRGTIEFKNKKPIKNSELKIQYGSKRLFVVIIACEILGILGIITGIVIQKRTQLDMT